MWRQLTHPEVVDDEERHRGEVCEVLLAAAVDRRVGDLLDEGVGLAVENAVALEDRRAADGLGEVALASPGRTEEKSVLAPGDEAACGELVDERAVHLHC